MFQGTPSKNNKEDKGNEVRNGGKENVSMTKGPPVSTMQGMSVNNEMTVRLEGGNYVGFEAKKKKKRSRQILNDTNNLKDAPTQDMLSKKPSVKDTIKLNPASQQSLTNQRTTSVRDKHNVIQQRILKSRTEKKLKLGRRKTGATDSANYQDENSIECQIYYHGLRPFEDFESVTHLVEHFKRHHIAHKLALKTKLKRPSHYISHSSFSYDETNGVLGKGNFAFVLKGTLPEEEDIEPTYIAVKVFTLFSDNDPDETRTERLLQIINEAKIMKNLDNQHIVKFYGIALDKFPISIVMELCSGGSLEKHLRIEKEKISVGERLFYCDDILNGACYMSDHQIVHRDLAARNILISNDGYLKIGDFGQAIHLQQSHSTIKRRNKVVSLWSPPECLCTDLALWNEKSDVWGFGMLVIEIFNDGHPPFRKEEIPDVIAKLKKGIYFDIPKSCHEDWSLVLKEGVFIKKQQNRFTFKQLKELMKALLTYNVNLDIPKPEDIALNRRGVKRAEFSVPERKNKK
uniref:Protein kinase domain-containing protein n=1 Tax=Parastrongyloides trichosuri TaxID=131310 RepID=A0A0N4ZNN4_PARTI